MTIGIIGADDRAVTVGKMLSGCGHVVCFSDPLHEKTPASAAHAIGHDAFACTASQQAGTCDALIFMVHWQDLDQTLRALGSYKDGIVIDATRPPDLGERSGAETIAQKLDNQHVVKALVENLEPGATIKVAADDSRARERVEELIAACGCTAENVGSLANARSIERHMTSRSVWRQ
jgi:predicted dinucleotide-binding enzyme